MEALLVTILVEGQKSKGHINDTHDAFNRYTQKMVCLGENDSLCRPRKSQKRREVIFSYDEEGLR